MIRALAAVSAVLLIAGCASSGSGTAGPSETGGSSVAPATGPNTTTPTPAPTTRAPGTGLDPTPLKLGDCFIPGKTKEALVGKYGSCSDVKATYQVSAVVKSLGQCPVPGSTTQVGVYKNFVLARVLCITIHWTLRRCYTFPYYAPRLVPCTTHLADQPVSIKPGTTASCPGGERLTWPNAYTRTTTCLRVVNV